MRATGVGRASLLVALALTLPAFAQAPRSPTPPATDASITTVEIARGLDHPWGLAFLPDGRMLVTERSGTLLLLAKGGRSREAVTGTPKVAAGGQGGLLGIALSPDFARDRRVYLSFSEAGEGGAAGTAVARGVLNDARLDDVEVIWRQVPKIAGSRNHWGSRLVFARDGTLFVTLGDRYSARPMVQDLSTTIGKVVRINPDGSIPKDNPFAGRAGARPEIWSYGHRNVQAAALDPGTGQLWTVEHGARGGDELNHPEAGKNYGWPVITYGVDYSGVKIGEGTAKAGMEQPVYYWDPVIAPSGAAFDTGDRYPGWKGDLFVGSLTPGGLVRLELRGGEVKAEARYLPDVGRVRDVVQGPDGYLYLLTDADDGKLLRVVPR
ncbi:MAG: PQQ-dependent sugar dehydrogenase [Burkholderiales bacterium]|nr:PQQ-dependent sugar dehydrogenase [Burkholderiales bacterium]